MSITIAPTNLPMTIGSTTELDAPEHKEVVWNVQFKEPMKLMEMVNEGTKTGKNVNKMIDQINQRSDGSQNGQRDQGKCSFMQERTMRRKCQYSMCCQKAQQTSTNIKKNGSLKGVEHCNQNKNM